MLVIVASPVDMVISIPFEALTVHVGLVLTPLNEAIAPENLWLLSTVQV